jgi:hypothetical protein
MAAVMNKTISGLRALASALLLGIGFSAYAGRLDPVSEHIPTLGLTNSGDLKPADSCCLPCVTPHLDGGWQGDNAGQPRSVE